jgi:two-component system response regulator NreC
VQSALAAGASAFVAKHVADRELLQTIRGVVSGSSFLCVVGDGPAAEVPTRYSAKPLEALSNREQQVLELLVLGNTNREIAAAIEIGTKSIETYRSRISQKLGLKSRAELVQYAIETGLLQSLVDRFPDKQ